MAVSQTAGGQGILRVYWGLTDGGTTPGNWQNVNDFGNVLMGAYSTTVSVRAGGPYFYRAYATNAASEDWEIPADASEAEGGDSINIPAYIRRWRGRRRGAPA
jgi:hypothetical protein